MKILGIETSTPAGGVALLDANDGLLFSLQVNSPQTHSERLMSSIAEALSRLQLKVTDLDAIAVSTGPGSFTGVRIGMSVAKGLAIATQKPLVGIRTLEALAYRFYLPDRLICPLIDARRAEVYAALFVVEKDGYTLRRLKDDFVATPQVVLKQITQKTIFSGNGALRYRDLILNTLGDLAEFPPLHRILPTAEEVAFLGLERLKSGKIDNTFTLAPYYVRPPDAEIARSQKALE